MDSLSLSGLAIHESPVGGFLPKRGKDRITKEELESVWEVRLAQSESAHPDVDLAPAQTGARNAKILELARQFRADELAERTKRQAEEDQKAISQARRKAAQKHSQGDITKGRNKPKANAPVAPRSDGTAVRGARHGGLFSNAKASSGARTVANKVATTKVEAEKSSATSASSPSSPSPSLPASPSALPSALPAAPPSAFRVTTLSIARHATVEDITDDEPSTPGLNQGTDTMPAPTQPSAPLLAAATTNVHAEASVEDAQPVPSMPMPALARPSQPFCSSPPTPGASIHDDKYTCWSSGAWCGCHGAPTFVCPEPANQDCPPSPEIIMADAPWGFDQWSDHMDVDGDEYSLTSDDEDVQMGGMIKKPRGRAGLTTTGQLGRSESPFGSISGNAGQPNGGMTNGFGAQAQGAGFSFAASAPSSNANQGFGTTNGNSGFSGQFFSLPGSQSQNQAAAAPDNSNSSSMFASPSTTSFNFGSTPSSQQQGASFSFGQPASNSVTTNGIGDAQQSKPSGSLFGSASNTSNLFGSSQQPSSSIFSTPGPQASSNMFGQSTTAASAPQTAPAKAASASLFGAQSQPAASPSAQPSFAFTSTSTAASKPLFGAQTQTTSAADASSADESMTSPDQSAKTSYNFGASTTPSKPPTTSLFAGFGQSQAQESSTTASSAAPPSAPATSSLFASSAQPAASSEASASKTPAKSTSNLFGTSSSAFTPTTGSLFATKPKAPESLFGTPKPATSSESGQLPWNKLDTPEQQPAPQSSTSNIFASSSAATPSAQATSQPGAALFSQPASTPVAKPSFTFGSTPSSTMQPPQQAQGSMFGEAATPMATLNSAASPRPATTTTTQPEVSKVFDLITFPDPPAYFNEAQKHQWFWAIRIKSLETGIKEAIAQYPGANRPLLDAWYAAEFNKLVNGLKRRRSDEPADEEDAPASKRVNTGEKLLSATPVSSNPLFGSRVSAPATANTTSNAFPTPTTAKPASSGTSLFATGTTDATPTSSSNLFSSSASASNPFSSTPSVSHSSTTRKSDDDANRSRENGTDEEVSYPKLPASSSKTSQLFAQVSNGPAESGSSQQAKTSFFPAQSTSTPTGSPSKPAASNNSSTPSFSVKPPTFAVPAAGTNFLAQFGSSAKKAAEEAAAKRKDDDYDSEEETEEEWAKRDQEAQKKKQAELEAAAKSTTGFVFKPSSDSANSKPLFKLGNTTSQPTNTDPPSSGSSLFGASSSTNKQASGSLFGATASTSKPDGASIFDTPAKSTNNAFGSSFFSSPANKDNTFKGDSNTPLKFSTSGTPAINLTASSPEKPSNTNGTATGPIGAGVGLFSKSQPIGGAPGGSIFAKNNTFSSSLAPASVASDTSRATSPGTTGDEEGDDESASKEEQLDLAGAAAGEEDEDVLFDVKSRAAQLTSDPKHPEATQKTWVLKGVGQLKLLRHQTTRQTRVILRSTPAGKVLLNTNLLPGVKYTAEKKVVRLPVSVPGGIDSWALTVKLESDAKKLADLLEENKSNVS